MALANFLGKSALSASQILKDFDYEAFQEILLLQRICICYEKKTINSSEGYATIDLLVRLLARLYPNLQLRCVDGISPDTDHFQEIAQSINPFIDISNSDPTAVIIVGDTTIEFSGLKIFIGSDQWLAKFSLENPQLSGNSSNRFGAGAAACFAAANLFRYVFNKQLPGAELDKEFIYSVFNGGVQDEAEQGLAIKDVIVGDTLLVGMGAIGNGAIWSMKDLRILGDLQLIDGERIDDSLSNLQRYVLATQDDKNQLKVEIARSFLSQAAVRSFPAHFDEYVAARGNWKIFRLAICVDSAKDRRLVQGSLPRRIINAWTGQEQCGISRHYNFVHEPCLACLYKAERQEKSKSLKIAESLGLSHPQYIMMVRQYMASQLPVDMPMIQLIAQTKGINPAALLPYAGKSLQSFYHEVICGGVMMQLTGTQQQAAEVPAAFESAMAGIMLAAEVVIDCGNLHRKKPSTIHRLNLLRPLTKYTHDNIEKSYSPDCICHDQVYRDVFTKKWDIKSQQRRDDSREFDLKKDIPSKETKNKEVFEKHP